MLCPITVIDTWTGRSWPFRRSEEMSGENVTREHNSLLPSTSHQLQHQGTPQLDIDCPFYAKSDSSGEEEVRRKRRQRVRRPPHQEGDPPPKRGRPTANPCWTHFARIESRLVRCVHCNKVVKSACATNMTKHLERHHRPLLMMTGGGGGGGEGMSASVPLVSVSSADQLHDGSSYLSYSTDTTSHHLGLSDHPSVIQHAPPAMEDIKQIKTELLEQPMINAINPWNSHNMLGLMDDSKAQSTQMNCADEATLRREQEAVWASGGGTGSSLPLDHSSVAASWDVVRPAAKRNRRTKHPVWELFRRTSSGQAQCQLCNAFVRSPCSSNFMGHLNRHHAEQHEKVYKKWYEGRRHSSVSESQVTSTTAPSGLGYSPQSNSDGTPSTPSGANQPSHNHIPPSTSSGFDSYVPFDYPNGVASFAHPQHFNMIPSSLNGGLDNSHSVLNQPNGNHYDLFNYAQPQHLNIPDQSMLRPPVFVDPTMHSMHQQPHHPQMPHPDQFGYGPPHSGMGHPHDQM